MNKVDQEYFRLVNLILEKGKIKHNRTGIDTIGIFGEQSKYEVSLNEFPILTTKKVFFKGIIHELLWFLSGSTNIKYLVDNDVHIWDEWAYTKYKKFLLSPPLAFYQKNIISQDRFIELIKTDNEFASENGELGEGTYGGMWRAFPYAKEWHWNGTTPEGADDTGYELQTVDQIQKVLDKLKTNPDDRRMIVSAWHPYWVDNCALPPCHCLFHFNTEELTDWERWEIYKKNGGNCGMTSVHEMNKRVFDEAKIPERRLNCLLYQRSCDSGLGIPFNITSYALLTAMIAQCVNMIPGVFTHSMGDLHIYKNHIDGLKEQLKREPKQLPKLWLNPEIKNIFDFKYDDIKLVNYKSHPTIKFDIAV